jgi:hypothetical protein
VSTWSLLDDPEPPPQPRWIWLLGVATLLVAACGGLVALVGHLPPHRAVATGPALVSRPACDPEKGRGLYQLGATPRDWAREHTVAFDPQHPHTSKPSWDTDPTLPRVHGQPGAVYNRTTTFEDCAIDSYYVQLAHRTPVSAALRRARRELPPDAHVLWRRTLPRCVQLEFASSTLSSQLRRRGDFTEATGALVTLAQPNLADVGSVTRIGFALKPVSIPQVVGGCLI